MAWYRVFLRDREGHFSGVRELEADDDAQAISRVGRMCRGLSCELWHDETLLCRWDGEKTDDPFGGTVGPSQAT
jgi:hypothetical protein